MIISIPGANTSKYITFYISLLCCCDGKMNKSLHNTMKSTFDKMSWAVHCMEKI